MTDKDIKCPICQSKLMCLLYCKFCRSEIPLKDFKSLVKKELIEDILSDLKRLKQWAKEHKEDAYDPIGSLIDDIDDTLIDKYMKMKEE